MGDQRRGEQVRVLRRVAPALRVAGEYVPGVGDDGAGEEGEDDEGQPPEGDEGEADLARAVGPGAPVEEPQELA